MAERKAHQIHLTQECLQFARELLLLLLSIDFNFQIRTRFVNFKFRRIIRDKASEPVARFRDPRRRRSLRRAS